MDLGLAGASSNAGSRSSSTTTWTPKGILSALAREHLQPSGPAIRTGYLLHKAYSSLLDVIEVTGPQNACRPEFNFFLSLFTPIPSPDACDSF